MISVLNGKMKTPKIAALYRLIDWVNEKECTMGNKNQAKIPKLPINSEPLSQNAWLSGFIEAEGHFSIRTTGVGNTVGKLTELNRTQTKARSEVRTRSSAEHADTTIAGRGLAFSYERRIY